MNERQTQVLNRVLDGLEGKPTAAQWEAIGECSADTAPRDINDLLARGVLRRLESGGRSTRYGVRGTGYGVRGTSCVGEQTTSYTRKELEPDPDSDPDPDSRILLKK